MFNFYDWAVSDLYAVCKWMGSSLPPLDEIPIFYMKRLCVIWLHVYIGYQIDKILAMRINFVLRKLFWIDTHIKGSRKEKKFLNWFCQQNLLMSLLWSFIYWTRAYLFIKNKCAYSHCLFGHLLVENTLSAVDSNMKIAQNGRSTVDSKKKTLCRTAYLLKIAIQTLFRNPYLMKIAI